MPFCRWDIAQRLAGRHKGCDKRGQDLATVWMVSFDATQPGAVADAATRPQDRRHFEIWKLLGCLPDLSVRRS